MSNVSFVRGLHRVRVTYPLELSPSGQNVSAALIMGAGTATYPETDASVDKNFFGYWLQFTGATGTNRGLYMRMYLTGGAGGETIRAYTDVQSAAPVDTCNGAHISLGFGSSAGNITGLGTAVRATVMFPASRTMGGTIAAIQAELYGEGANSVLGGEVSFIRMVADGNSSLKGEVDDKGYLFSIQGLSPATAHLCYVNTGTDPTNSAGSLRIKIGGTAYYLMFYAAQAA